MLEGLPSTLPPIEPFSFLLGGATTLTLSGLLLLLQKGTKRFPTTASIPSHLLGSQRTLKGKVLKVGDADGFRFFHTPLLRPAPSLKKGFPKGFFGRETIPVRLAGVDAPEGGYFGGKAQPLSEEAKAYLNDLLLGRYVWIRLLMVDQYHRVVGFLFSFLFFSFLFFLASLSFPLVRSFISVIPFFFFLLSL